MNRKNLCPAPECGLPVLATKATEAILDRRERLWHRGCALQALSEHFRTPLDLEALDGEIVEFEVPGEHAEVRQTGNYTYGVLRAPRNFILRAIRFGGDFGLHGVFVGSQNLLGYAPTATNAIYGDDLNGRLLHVSEKVTTGMDITLQLTRRSDDTSAPHLTLLGELFDPARRRATRLDHPFLVVGGLYSDELVDPGESVRLLVAPYIQAHFERIAADDHEGWDVERVKICCFAGDLMGELAAGRDGLVDAREVPVEPRPLRDRVTALPTFAAHPGETVAVYMRNRGRARRFSGRLIGAGVP